MKYGKPIWQWVAEAADRLEGEVFTSSDIVKEVHETSPDVPEISIRSYVTAMAPNHPFSGHWPSTRNNHPYFHYLGNGKFKLLKPTVRNSKTISLSPLQRFQKSMEIDYEKWHDGIGYDIDAIGLASPTERKAIEQLLIQHTPRDWRDIEALAKINTRSAQETIRKAIKNPNPSVRVAVTRFAPKLVTESERSHSIIDALQRAEIFGGISQVLDDIEEYHPMEVKEELIAGLLSREGDVAVLFAAMLFHLYGKAKEPFDMNQRPFFMRFNTENKQERVQAFRELCKQLNINSEKYLATRQT